MEFPSFTFDPAQTAGSFGADAGFGFASFLLGDVNQASASEPDNTYGRRKSVSLYAQDATSRSHRNSRLNADLRWDFNGRYHEKYGHWSNFNTTAVNPVTGLLGIPGVCRRRRRLVRDETVLSQFLRTCWRERTN
jgi:hypothetical protein